MLETLLTPLRIHQNRVKPFWNLPPCALLAGSHMSNVKRIGTAWPTVGVLAPKLDFVEDRNRNKRDRNFWSGVVEVFLQRKRMLVPGDSRLEGLVEKFSAIIIHQVGKGDGLRGVACHLDVRLMNDWREGCWESIPPRF